ncbi:hypothetical protein [Micromonospora sp. NBC_00421]
MRHGPPFLPISGGCHGQDTYPFRRPGEERVIVRITPTQKLGMG